MRLPVGWRLALVMAVILSVSGLPFSPVRAAGASLAVAPSGVSVQVGKTFSVNINAVAGEPINSASGVVNYSTSLLQATSVSLSGSVFTLWTDSPSAGSSISFGGGLPTPGLVGTGKLFSITFKALAAGTATISISGGKALANDGQGTNVYTGQSGSTVTISQVLTDLTISSSTHPSPSKWYNATTATLNWNKPSDISSFDYSLTGPDTKSASTTATTVTFPNLAEGKWSFQLTGHSSKQDRTASFSFQIDTTPPSGFQPTVAQSSPTDPYPVVSFNATDALSGIDHYEVAVDTNGAKTTTDTSLKLDRQLPGTHTVTVKAVDKAGNATTATASFTIKGFPGPTITDYDRFVSVLQPISLTGKALFGATVRLYVDGKASAEFAVKENLSTRQRQINDVSKYKSDDTVEWNYFFKGTLLPGPHTIAAIQIKPDTSESEKSNTITTRVLWSSINIAGQTVPLAVIVVILLGLLLLLTGVLLWVWRHSRRFVGSWRGRLTDLKREVDDTLEEMKDNVHEATDKIAEQPQPMKDVIASDIKGTIKEIDSNLDKAIDLAAKEEHKKPPTE